MTQEVIVTIVYVTIALIYANLLKSEDETGEDSTSRQVMSVLWPVVSAMLLILFAWYLYDEYIKK
jgi:heme/copper-type cytochrome/quinol oxidase subunit 2